MVETEPPDPPGNWNPQVLSVQSEFFLSSASELRFYLIQHFDFLLSSFSLPFLALVSPHMSIMLS